MMISCKDVVRFGELEILIPKAASTLKILAAEMDDIEGRIIQAVDAGERVEGKSPYRLKVEIEKKRYQPAYRACAIEFADEARVAAWALAHNNNETKRVLVLVPKLATAILMSKPVQAVLDALKKVAAPG